MDVTLWWGVAETTHKTAAAILSKFPYLKVLYRYTIESLIGLIDHSAYRTVCPYWILPVYVVLIQAVWADDGDRPLLF
jgi:hypothetical protein